MNLHNYKEQVSLNNTTTTQHTNWEIDFDIETIKSQVEIIKKEQAERFLFVARVKWHEEGEKIMHTS